MNHSNKKKILTFILIMISITWAATASAQSAGAESIIPGSAELHLEKVQPYAYEFHIFMINDGKETLRGTLTEEVRILKQQNVIERIQGRASRSASSYRQRAGIPQNAGSHFSYIGK